MRWVKLMTSWLRRDIPTPPPPPPAERLQAAREAATHATDQLRQAHAQDARVTARAAHAEALHHRNNLGPAFMRALRPGR